MPTLDQLPREDFLRAQLKQVASDLSKARKVGGWTAVTGFRRHLLTLRDELDELLAAKAAESGEGLTPEERYAKLLERAEQWPDKWFEGLMGIYAERKNVVWSATRRVG